MLDRANQNIINLGRSRGEASAGEGAGGWGSEHSIVPLLVPYRGVTGGDYRFYTCPSIRPSVCLSVHPQSFPDFSPLCAQLLHWNFLHSFISMPHRSILKMVAIDQYLEELCPLRDFTVFRTFFSLLIDIHLICGTLLCHTKIQIEFGIDFSRNLEKSHELSVFRTFSLSLSLSAYRYSFNIWYIVLPY
jgi:hypothetical protein